MYDKIKSISIYVIAVILVTIGFICFNIYREGLLSQTIKDTLQEYFKDNNDHIASRDFSISNIEIKCRGNNAYLVDFIMFIANNTPSETTKLGAVVYQSNDTWNVKGFGRGLTAEELKTFNFKCYD